MCDLFPLIKQKGLEGLKQRIQFLIFFLPLFTAKAFFALFFNSKNITLQQNQSNLDKFMDITFLFLHKVTPCTAVFFFFFFFSDEASFHIN